MGRGYCMYLNVVMLLGFFFLRVIFVGGSLFYEFSDLV